MNTSLSLCRAHSAHRPFPWILAAGLLLFGAALRAASDAPAKTAQIASSHRLQPMDLIKLQVYREPDLDRELRVSQDYTVVVPLLGTIDVTGRTLGQLQILLTELYRQQYLANPQLNLTILEYAQRTVNVLGAVNSPGAIVLPPERTITFLDAIARAGGFGRMANRAKVTLIRPQPDGTTVNRVIDADQLMAGDSSNRVPVQDGDTILVPERLL